ncbi:MAG: queuosine salvage family protein [Promethearchaeota archaeon]
MSFTVNTSVTIFHSQCQELGRHLQKLNPHVEDFLNPHLFPPKNTQTEDTARFFFFITAIDHRTSPVGQSFEGKVDGNYFQGADLLWHLSVKRFLRNPQLFHPAKMAKITEKQIITWYTVHSPSRVIIANPGERAKLLRNCGQVLLDKYEGSVLTLLNSANHRISSDPENVEIGLLSLLSQFKAYEDPVNKKSFLFLKFLLRRNLWTHKDTDQLRIPVDNHLTRIALRTGIVNPSAKLTKALQQRHPISLAKDVELRERIGDAYSLVSKYSSRSVLELDDFFWHFGRNCCLLDSPVCVTGCTSNCYVEIHLLSISCQNRCPLASICYAYADDAKRSLVEPKVKTWYY